MNFKKGKDRKSPMEIRSLEDRIEVDNPVRLIDFFVESLDLGELGFKVTHASEGRPPYHPSVLLKLYIYGYMNSVRSSRKLEKATKINLEVMWLLNDLSPDHNTISNFRKNHEKQIKEVFKKTVSLSIDLDLIGKKLLAGDGTRLRAQNSKKNNFTEKKIDQHLRYIENKLLKYLGELAGSDGKKKKLKEEIAEQEKRKEQYLQLKEELNKSEETQVSLSDPDARLLAKNRTAEVGYNVQSVVDAANNLLVDYKVTNTNDYNALGGMLERAINTLGLEKDQNGKLKEEIEGLFDTGYYSGKEFKKAHDLGVKTYVPTPKIGKKYQVPNPSYNLSNFKYSLEKDTYTCPTGELLTTTSKWHLRKNKKVKQYKTKACESCPVKKDCTKSKNRGRVIERNEYKTYCDINQENIISNPELYRRRQAIVEHPFGTIKRSWGATYILTKKGIDRASADVGFMFISYNLCRIFNILDFEQLKTHY